MRRFLIILAALLCTLPMLAQFHYPSVHVETSCYGCADQSSQWFAQHFDAVNGGVPDSLLPYNSNMLVMGYALNWSTFDDYAVTFPGYGVSLNDAWEADAATWATANSVNIENLYLHTAVGYNPTSCSGSTKTYLGDVVAQTWGAGCSYVAGDLVASGAYCGPAPQGNGPLPCIYVAAASSTGQAPSNTTAATTYWQFLRSSAGPALYCPTPGSTYACRLSFDLWSEYESRWAANPGNANLVAYQQNRLPRLLSYGIGSWNGIWWDEFGASELTSYACGTGMQSTLEYGTSCTQYLTDIASMLTAEKSVGIPMQINNAQAKSVTDTALAAAAGGVYTELLGIITGGDQASYYWLAIDNYIAAGATTAFVMDWPVLDSIAQGCNGPIPVTGCGAGVVSMSPGNYDTAQHRYQMSDLVSNYMLTPNLSGQNFYWAPVNRYYPSTSMSATWPAAIGTDVGVPTQARQAGISGTDGAGQSYQIYSRTFTKALMLMNPQYGDVQPNYGDSSAVTVTLPTGSWSRLNADGTTTPVSGTIQLRHVEGVIMMSGSGSTGAVFTSGKFIGVYR